MSRSRILPLSAHWECDTAARQKRAKNFTNWSSPGKKWDKRHFQNDLSSAAPCHFLASKPILVKNPNFRKKNKFVRPPKPILKKLCSIEAIQRVQRKWTRSQNAKIAPKPLVLKCFTSFYLLECAVKTRDAKHEKKQKFFRAAKKRKMTFKMELKKQKKIRKQSENS